MLLLKILKSYVLIKGILKNNIYKYVHIFEKCMEAELEERGQGNE